jgi:probable F420-dependent oxidoreductase
MQIGALFPTGEIGTDAGAIRAYAQGVEGLGYAHVTTYEHVLGAGVANRPQWQGPYTSANPFHEPLVLYAFLAGVTSSLEFGTCVLVGPQRQTALLAKQSAELAILSGNRFRLGIGLGWNRVEYEALGVPWEGRGRRLNEQIALLRQLWSEDVVDFHGDFHTVDEAGINPLPTKSIPIWLGGDSQKTLERVARVCDGWMAPAFTAADAEAGIGVLRKLAAGYGRDVGIDGRVVLAFLGDDRDVWAREAAHWHELGATHLTFTSHGLGCATVDDHLRVLQELRELWPVESTSERTP